jgi:hypothetical protein
MRSPENYERSQEMGEAFIQSAHNKARKILAANRVDIEDFDGFYPEAKLKADAEYVRVRKSQYEITEEGRVEKAKKMSEIAEAMVVDPKVIRSWYSFTDEAGKQVCDVSATGTSELDDLANGVDAVWEMQHSTEGYSNLALAVDITFAREFEEKIQFIKGDIANGRLARIEYFMPKWGDIKGEATQIPRVVIGLDAKNLSDVAPIWSRIEERRGEMANHPMQKLILEEILYQLPVYERYAREVGHVELAEKVRITYLKFKKLHHSVKKKIPGYSDFVEDDRVFAHLREYLEHFDQIPRKTSSNELRSEINKKHGI